MRKSRTENATRNAITGIINRVVGLLIPFIIRTIIIKVLGAEYLGLNNLFTSILQVLNLADLGFNTAIVYSMYEPIAKNDITTVNALLYLFRRIYYVIAFIIFIVGILLTPFLKYLISGGYPDGLNIQILYLMYLVNTVISYLVYPERKCLLAAFQRSDIDNTIGAVVQLVFDAIKIIVLLTIKNYYIYVLFLPLSTLFNSFLTAWYSYKLFPLYKCQGKIELGMKKDIVKRVSGLAIQKFGNTISTSLDSIVITSILGLVSAAIYSNYYYVSSCLMAIMWICITSATAGIGNSIVVDRIDNIKKNFYALTHLNHWCLSWTSACLFVLYQHFMIMWVGSDLIASNIFVLCMTVYFYVGQMRKIVLMYKDAAGIWWEDKYKPLVGCIINLAFNIISVKYIGIIGVILSTIISFLFVEFPWESVVLFKLLFKEGIWRYYLRLAKYTVVTIINCIICYRACLLLPESGLVWFLFKGIICFFISNIIFIIAFRKSEENRYIFSKLMLILR